MLNRTASAKLQRRHSESQPVTPFRKLAVGLLLTLSAGFTDAVGFVELSGYFTSFMSGNTTQLAFGLANGLLDTIALPASLVACFFIGGLTGSMLGLRANRWAATATLLLVFVMLGLALLLAKLGWPPTQALLFLAASAGAQNAVLRPAGSARLGATYVTGTLFMASQELAQAIYGKAPRWLWAQHALVWVSLLVGAVIGAAIHLQFGMYALAVPLLLYFVLVVRALVRRGIPS